MTLNQRQDLKFSNVSITKQKEKKLKKIFFSGTGFEYLVIISPNQTKPVPEREY